MRAASGDADAAKPRRAKLWTPVTAESESVPKVPKPEPHRRKCKESRDAFRLIEEAGLLTKELSSQMQKMVGFRNIAVDDYRKLSLEILRSILDTRLGDFRDSARTVIGVA